MSVDRAVRSWNESDRALRALDRRLVPRLRGLRAHASQQSGSGTDLAMERFAGLYLDPREVARLASRPPGEFGSLVRGKHNEEPEPLTDVMPPESRLAAVASALRLAVRGRRLAARACLRDRSEIRKDLCVSPGRRDAKVANRRAGAGPALYRSRGATGAARIIRPDRTPGPVWADRDDPGRARASNAVAGSRVPRG